MLDRRDFLKSAGLLTLGATMMPEVAMAKKPKKAKPGKKQIGFCKTELHAIAVGSRISKIVCFAIEKFYESRIETIGCKPGFISNFTSFTQ